MTSLGKGIGLQSPNRDDYWIKESVRLDEQQKAKAEKDANALFSMADLKVDGKVLLPAYGKAAAKVQLDLYNKFALYNQQNPHVAKNLIQQDVVRAQQELSSIYSGNEQWKRYAETKGIMKDNEALNAAFSTETELPQLQKYNNDFMFTDEKGGFNFVEVPDTKILPKYDKYGMQQTLTGKEEVVGGTIFADMNNSYAPEAIQQEGLTMSSDPTFRLQKLFEARNWKPEAGESLESFAKRKTDYVNSEGFKRAQENVPPSFTTKEKATIYRPPAESASDKPKPQAIVNPPTERTMVTRYGADSGKIGVSKIPFSANVQNSKVVEIPIGKDIYDSSTNLPLKGTGNISIKPTTVIPVKTNAGTWKNMVIGKVVKSSSADGDMPMTYGDMFSPEEMKMIYGKDSEKKLKQEINIEVPYESVKGTIESSHSMDDYFKSFDELKQGAKPVKMITVEAFGKVGLIPEDQFEAVKKKDPNAKIR